MLAVTYLTNMIYISIEYACGSGDLACVSRPSYHLTNSTLTS
jgi:hypothetical protein